MESYKKYEPIFGSWKIKRKIGEGNFGAVFEIEREDFDVKYKSALKIITVPRTQSEVKNATLEGMTNENVTRYFKQVVEDIAKEFALMSKLKGNSNIVSYEDHMVIEHTDEIGWDILIRMELLTPLTDCLQKGQFTEKDVIKVGMDICRALIICQKNNIVHRDIKLENIFVSDNGDYKLGDFGIARQIEKTTNELSKKGTQVYMAPELYRGDKCTNSVDIYSLGIVLYRLLNQNRIPFMPDYPKPITFDDKERATYLRMNGEKVPALKNVNKKLNDIVLKACEFNPENRYKEPKQMYDELEELLHKDFTENYDVKKAEKKANKTAAAKSQTADSTKNDAVENTEVFIDNSNGEFEKTEVFIDSSADEFEKTEVFIDSSADEFEKTEILENEYVPSENNSKPNMKKGFSKKALIAGAAAAVAIVGGVIVISGMSSEKVPEEIPVISIAGVPDSMIMEMGVDMPMTVNVEPADATNKEVKYKVVNGDEYLSINESGVMIPEGVGEADVEISAGDIEKKVHITVIENREVKTKIEQSKALLIEKHNNAKQVLENIINDTSINQDNIGLETNALKTALSGYDEKINSITKIEEISEFMQYYDDTVQNLITGLNNAYSNAIEIEKNRKEAEQQKKQVEEEAKQKAKEEKRTEKKASSEKKSTQNTQNIQNTQSTKSTQNAPKLCPVCGSSTHTTHPEEKKAVNTAPKVCPVCGSSEHTTHPEEKINLNRNLLG